MSKVHLAGGRHGSEEYPRYRDWAFTADPAAVTCGTCRRHPVVRMAAGDDPLRDSPRMRAIMAMAADGANMAQIGRAVGLSGQRVRQLIDRREELRAMLEAAGAEEES
jgi:hypothetical protein